MRNASPKRTTELYLSAENRDDLVAALKTTLECPMISEISR